MRSMFAPLFRTVAQVWAFLRDTSQVLKPCRFSVFVLLAGGALLLAVPQGQELTVRLGDEEKGFKRLWFCLAVVWWAFQSWYWARYLLDASFGDARVPKTIGLGSQRASRVAWLVNQVPRVISFLSYAVAVVACVISKQSQNLLVAAGLVVLGIANYYLLVKRRSLTQALISKSKRGGMSILRPGNGTGFAGLSPLSKLVFLGSLAASAGFMVWAIAAPVSMGWTLGAAAVPFIGFAAIVPVGSLAVYLGRKGGVARLDDEQGREADPAVSYPVVTSFVLMAVVFSLWVDNHQVRTINEQSERQPMTLEQAVDDWYANAAVPAAPAASGAQPKPLVIVATAGGGIRAAYWTATVLGALRDRVPGFEQQLLAVSGVSGGSVGATTYTTLLALDHKGKLPASCSVSDTPGVQPGRFECLGQRVLSQDFLAPTVSALLFSDLLQQFIPYSFLPDRAAALEQGWEQAWGEVSQDPEVKDVWSKHSFDSLWREHRGTGRLPALLLNGTSVETGNRVITSNLAIDRATFPDSFDFFQMLASPNASTSIRPSTAAHNSARFTYVSPAGRINKESRLVDGGYHENFGAKTASELLAASLARLRSLKLDAQVKPIVVIISNDPKLDPSEMPPTGRIRQAGAPCSDAAVKQPNGISFTSEIISPLLTLLATRNAHGLNAAWDLHQTAASAGNGHLYHFRLCNEPGEPEPALGWVLSKQSEQVMRRQLRSKTCDNGAQLEELVKLLGG